MPAAGAVPSPPSPLGLGGSRIGSFGNPMSDAESRRLVQGALDLGVRVLDTSNIYGQGDSERVIGQAIKGRRGEAWIITKTGLGFSARMRLLRPLKPLLRPLLARRGPGNAVSGRRAGEMRREFSPAGYAASLEASLRRLGTDHVEGFLLHGPDADEIADPAVADALARLKTAGKVLHYGVSCDDRAGLDAALAMPGLTLLQLPWPLLAQDGPGGPIGRAAARGVVVVAREVIRAQPALPPVQAVVRAVAAEGVSCALVGTGSIVHLQALVGATR